MNDNVHNNNKPHQVIYSTGPQTDLICHEAKRCDRIIRDMNVGITRGDIKMNDYYKLQKEVDDAIQNLHAALSEVRKKVRQTGRKRSRPAKKKTKKATVKTAEQYPEGSAAAKVAPRQEPTSIPGTRRRAPSTGEKSGS